GGAWGWEWGGGRCRGGRWGGGVGCPCLWWGAGGGVVGSGSFWGGGVWGGVSPSQGWGPAVGDAVPVVGAGGVSGRSACSAVWGLLVMASVVAGGVGSGVAGSFMPTPRQFPTGVAPVSTSSTSWLRTV